MAESEKTIAVNRRARHEYHLEETYEAGLVLTGTEVKSLRAGRGSIQEAFGRVQGGEVWLQRMHIPPYEQGNRFNHDPLRTRKLLLHRREINRLIGKVQQRGYTLILVRLYFKRGVAKVEIALARGKRQYDKREAIAKRDARREMDRAMSARGRGKERTRG
ncbi:MAG: SsrA-binding protein SmpB [Armatimonadetes bacterium]|nr:SsrA-binding protein SmpB [Armatimonadota bacterium]